MSCGRWSYRPRHRTGTARTTTERNDMKTVAIGGTGLIGSKLVTKLDEHGHEAVPASSDTGVSYDRVTAVSAHAHCLAPDRVDAPLGEPGRYGRMFDLPALEVDEALLHQIGAVGGFSDAGDSHGDARAEAGRPYFGQYVAHDLTADRSPLRAHADVRALRNMRAPRANLESLYGGGPVGSPYLYRREDPAKLLEDDGDVPRNQEGIALLGDPRNDTHVFMSQMQVAFIRAHNRLVDRLRADGVAEEELFAEGRLALIWHYQWLIVNDLLPGAIGRELVDELLGDGP